MEIYSSRENFGFSISLLGSTRRTTTVNKLALAAFQHIMTSLFVTLDMFALVVPYLFYV